MADSGNRPESFWREALSLRGAPTHLFLPGLIAFGALATLVYFAYLRWLDIAIQVGPHEVAGALLGILLMMRTNAGYDRWWEARKAWGGIVNQSRNLVLAALA